MRTLPLAAAALLLTAGIAHAEEIQTFRSPSGYIHCMAGHMPGVVECQIPQPDRPIRPKPRDCELDWGGTFSLARNGKAEMLCVGDTVASPDSRVLPYGQTLRGNGWQCTSQRSGITCTNRQGRGFEISSRRQRLF